jgi:hypothetical protein
MKPKDLHGGGPVAGSNIHQPLPDSQVSAIKQPKGQYTQAEREPL